MAKRKPSASTIDEPTVPPVEEYTVLARRYRPQQFDDLVGQEPVAQALVNALKSNRVAHAYLFTGARGVGKTSTARILAKALNCQNGPTAKPCDDCELCRGIATGEDVDVLEIDGASNRGIDEVREIRQNVQYRPSRARYKIYIIDEVHMLTPPAFNALLKTLEEPPPHVKFIFATTEAQKIPVTILSRCQRFDFAGIGTTQIVNRLREIVAGEGMEAEDDALALVARRAAGSMRDAQSLLDQLLAFGGSRLTPDQVHALLGTASAERVAALASAILAHNARQALELLAPAADSSLQLAELLDQLIEYWRDLLVVNCAGPERQALSVSGPQRETLVKQAQALDADTILAGLDVLASAKARLRNTSHGRVVLEMALVRLSRLENLVSLAQLSQLLTQDGMHSSVPSRLASVQASPAAAPPAAARPVVEPPEKKKPADGILTDNNAQPAASVPLSAETLRLVWSQVLAQLGPFLASELAKTENVAIFGPNTLVIRFPPGYNWDENHYLDPTRVGRVEEALRNITGQPCHVRIETSSPAQRLAVPSREAATTTEIPPTPFRRHREEAMQLPLITRAMDVLGAQLVHVDEEFGALPQPVAGDGADTSNPPAQPEPPEDA